MSSFDTALHQTQTYTVTTPVYEGPLDLLLQLIERAELDITRLALAQVTQQYLDHINEIREKAAEEVSAFVVIAAKLIQIKSEVLLPRRPERDASEEEEDPGEALARQLIAYKRYKEIAQFLEARAANGFATYVRLAAPPKVEGKLDLQGWGLPELVGAAHEVFQLREPSQPLDSVVAKPQVTIREKITDIVSTIRDFGRATFRGILRGVHTRLDVVVSFLALLELVKRHRVAATQDRNFSDIVIQPAEAWEDEESFELEFS